MCGTGHRCAPLSQWFHFSNHGTHLNELNDEGLIDIKYSGHIGRLPFQVYAQEMNEVQSNPLPQTVSNLYGGTVLAPTARGIARLTLEWADTIPTYQLFWGHEDHGFAYNNFQFPDGMRYRGRTLGFSLDSDSKLLSVSGDWISNGGTEYRLTFNHANVSTSQIAANNGQFFNAVTAAPVTINMAEARLSFPFRRMMVDLAVSAQDDQPRPDRGFSAAAEVRVRAAL
jgi:hypothetical protein